MYKSFKFYFFFYFTFLLISIFFFFLGRPDDGTPPKGTENLGIILVINNHVFIVKP